MKAETWFTAQGAVEYGLADVIIGEDGRAAGMTTTAARAKLAEMQRQLDEAVSRFALK